MFKQADIPLHVNESYWLLDERLYSECLPKDPIDSARYPDYGALIDAIAAYAQAPRDHIALFQDLMQR